MVFVSMDDPRKDSRPNGIPSRSSSVSGPATMMQRKVSSSALITDPSQFAVTGFDTFTIDTYCSQLGEAMYTYFKMRDAEQEKRLADADYQKFSQFFETNPKTKEALEARRNKVERNFKDAEKEYVQAAREVEPLLRGLTPTGPRSASSVSEEQVQIWVEREIRKENFVRLPVLDAELHNLDSKLVRGWKSELRREVHGCALQSDHDRLQRQVDALSARTRQLSGSDDGARDTDQRIASNARELQKIRSELEARQRQYERDMAGLEQRLSTLQVSKPPPTPDVPKESIVKVYLKHVSLIEDRRSASEGTRSYQRPVYNHPRLSITAEFGDGRS